MMYKNSQRTAGVVESGIIDREDRQNMAKSASDMTPVQMATMRLEQSIANLSGVVDVLSDRLEPALGSPHPEKESPVCNRDFLGDSNLRAFTDESTLRIDRVADRIVDLLKRLEL